MIFIIKNNVIRFLFLSIIISLIFASCGDSGCTDPTAENYNSDATDDDGSCLCSESNPCLEINFRHFVDELEIIYSNDNIIYQNNAANMYSVRRLLYVLSNVNLHFVNGSSSMLNSFIFVNTDDTQTLTKTIYNLPALCSGISFRLGFSSPNNIDNEYIDADDNFHLSMLWPNLNGTDLAFQGGYHYMKLEGKYVNLVDGENFYNIHTGPINGEDFSILYSQFSFDPSSSISINMNVNNWYNDPVYSMDVFGSAIMGNLDAQTNLYQNGLDIFSIESE